MPLLRSLLALALFAVSSFLAQTDALASPLPPNVHASSSSNGQFLVVTEENYSPAGPDGPKRLAQITYRVWEREPFLNAKDRLSASVPFWSSSLGWSLTLDVAYTHQPFWPMVSDDGQTLALLAVAYIDPRHDILKIYRRKLYGATLVRSFRLSDLWTAREIDPEGTGVYAWTDASPEWFAGGKFSFSPDSEQFLYTTPWKDRLHIHLRDGSVTREHP